MGRIKDPKSIVIASQVVNRVRGGILGPILPFFLYSLSNRSYFILTLMNNSSLLVSFVLSPIMGAVVDRVGRKKPIIIASTIVGLSLSFLTSYVTSYQEYILITLAGSIIGIAGGLAFSSLMADIFSRKKRGRLLGIYNSMGLVGSIAGNIISAYFYNFVGIRETIRIIALSGLVTVVLYLFLNENGISKAKERISIRDIVKKDLVSGFKSKVVFRLFTLQALTRTPAVLTSGIMAIYFTRELGGTPEEWAILAAITTIAGLAYIPYGYLVDKIGRKKILYFSIVGWIVLYIGYGISRDPLTFSMFFIIPIGSAYSLAYTAILYDLTDGGDRGKIFGTLGSLNSVYVFIVSLIGAYIADIYSPRILFFISLAPLLASLFIVRKMIPDIKGTL